MVKNCVKFTMGPCQKVEDPGAAGWAYICIALCCNYYGYLATLSAPNYLIFLSSLSTQRNSADL